MEYPLNDIIPGLDLQNITEILEPFQPSIQASLDGTHETIEYTRDGCNWPDIQKHWKEYNEVLMETIWP